MSNKINLGGSASNVSQATPQATPNTNIADTLSMLNAAQSNPALVPLFEELLRRQIQQFEQMDEAKKVAHAEAQALQLSKIRADEAARAQKVAQQAQCRHMDENNKFTSVRGNRDGRGLVIGVCQKCSKVWKEDPVTRILLAEEDGKPLPPQCAMDSHHIGGATY